MLSQFHTSYQRMEQALQRLTDSIAAYNPSPAAADELVAADDALSEDLEQLFQHQRNYRRIEELKRITQENDDKVKSHIRSLAEVRKEIAAIPSTETIASGREVSVDELLSYARFISPTTIPPTFRQQDIPIRPARRESEAPDTHIANGIATPAAAGVQEGEATPAYVKSGGVSTRVMNEQDKAFLDPLANLPFHPWPSHEVMQMGALADIQRMIEAGRDPASVLSAEEQAEAEQKRKEEEERERLEEEERIRRRASMFDTSVRRRGTVQDDVFDPDA